MRATANLIGDGIAASVARRLVQAGDTGPQSRQRIEQVFVVAADRIPEIADTRGPIIAFGTDRAGEILMTRNDGQIHRLVPVPAALAPTAEFPRRLSETGLFASTARHAPAPGVVPYELNAGVWSDGAHAQRMLSTPRK